MPLEDVANEGRSKSRNERGPEKTSRDARLRNRKDSPLQGSPTKERMEREKEDRQESVIASTHLCAAITMHASRGSKDELSRNWAAVGSYRGGGGEGSKRESKLIICTCKSTYTRT